LAESPFEREVIGRLVSDGYDVTPQVWVGGYRLDMVVRTKERQVALECDGDRYHGMEQIPADLARQAVLERVGWRFVRVRGTQFYRDPDGTMQAIRAQLEKLGITPSMRANTLEELSALESVLVDEVRRRAWEFMRQHGWLQEVESIEDETVETDYTESDERRKV
jgi:very-short-patch-repair endonuclease